MIDILAGEELSFLSEEQQNNLEFALLENPQHINLPKAKQLRLAAKNGTLSLEKNFRPWLAGKSGNSKRAKTSRCENQTKHLYKILSSRYSY